MNTTLSSTSVLCTLHWSMHIQRLLTILTRFIGSVRSTLNNSISSVDHSSLHFILRPGASAIHRYTKSGTNVSPVSLRFPLASLGLLTDLFQNRSRTAQAKREFAPSVSVPLGVGLRLSVLRPGAKRHNKCKMH